MVVDGSRYRTERHLIEKVAMSMPRLEEVGPTLEGVATFCRLDKILRYWQTPLDASAQELVPVVIERRLYTPARVP